MARSSNPTEFPWNPSTTEAPVTKTQEKSKCLREILKTLYFLIKSAQNRKFYPTPRIAYIREVKRLKMLLEYNLVIEFT